MFLTATKTLANKEKDSGDKETNQKKPRDLNFCTSRQPLACVNPASLTRLVHNEVSAPLSLHKVVPCITDIAYWAQKEARFKRVQCGNELRAKGIVLSSIYHRSDRRCLRARCAQNTPLPVSSPLWDGVLHEMPTWSMQSRLERQCACQCDAYPNSVRVSQPVSIVSLKRPWEVYAKGAADIISEDLRPRLLRLPGCQGRESSF